VCLAEELIDEGAQLDQVGHTEGGSPPRRQVIGIRDTQVGPLDRDAEERSVRELQSRPFCAITGTAIEERETLALKGMKGMSDDNAGIRRTAYSLLRA
jgi:hypothetical protein